MGGKNSIQYDATHKLVLSCLSSEWTRYNIWEKATGLDPGTFNKHRKKLIVDGLVEARKESRRLSYYRRSEKAEEVLRGYYVQGLFEVSAYARAN
jgi:DNA-binding transcriptional ArsR family regulator